MRRFSSVLMALMLVAAFCATAATKVDVVAQIKPKLTVQTTTQQEMGFDACTTPTVSQMQAWWNSSPYFTYFFYLGGVNRAACGGATLDANWLSNVMGQGWTVVPIWVGPQMQYGTCRSAPAASYISMNATTAYNQGYQEASTAVNTLGGLGISPFSQPPLAYDLEGYNGGANCRAAAQDFINGWDYFMSTTPQQDSGVYGSTCSSYLNDFSIIAHPPSFIWGAVYDGNTNVNVMSCIPSSNWINSQRHKQYRNTHPETWGTVALKIDSDCSNGPVSGTVNNGALDGRCLQ